MSNKAPSILIVDDEANVCWSLKEFLSDEGYAVSTASSAEEAIGIVEARLPDVLLLDILLPGMSGLEFLDWLQEKSLQVSVIMMTAHGGMSTAIAAIQKGAYEYLTKPFDLDKVAVVIARALESRKLTAEVVKLRSRLGGGFRLEDVMVGNAPQMQAVYKKIGAVASSDVTVLIQGESGTGKELTARAIHFNSPRQNGPFVPINCGALPESLLESELYGHVKGAFTGAVANRRGKFEQANGGSIFLDEIGDVSPAIQVSLLRFLEDRVVERVGENKGVELDVRVIAASNQNLEELVAAGSFREDLFYRLKVVDITLPALRERAADIPILVEYLLKKNNYSHADISAHAMKIFSAYHWPGNVRELRNAVEHALTLGRGAVVLPEHLPPYLQEPGHGQRAKGDVLQGVLQNLIEDVEPSAGNVFEDIMDVWEEPFIRLVMKKFGGNQVKASEYLGIHRTTFRNKLKKYNLV